MYKPRNKYICLIVFLLMMVLLISSLGSCTPRATGRTLIIREGLSAQEADAWRPSPEDRVKYKYFRKGS